MSLLRTDDAKFLVVLYAPVFASCTLYGATSQICETAVSMKRPV